MLPTPTPSSRKPLTMAFKITVTVTLLFFLFSLSVASTQLDLPDDDVVSTEFKKPEPTTIPAILLPNQKPESESESESEFEVKYPINEETEEKTESKSSKEEQGEPIETVPLTVVTFRPINHHFPRYPLLPLRRGHRCRHGHRNYRVIKPRFFGNDMIVSSGGREEDLAFDDRVRRGGVTQVPGKWAWYDNGAHRFSFRDDDDVANREEGPHHHHHHHHHLHRHEEADEEEHEHEHKGGLFHGIRKFLDHHF